ncbi:PAS domain S-box protein [candidate division KSB1 bacterium]|nr:PAS domain S-box protein [candidate division KSB1 bacterium]
MKDEEKTKDQLINELEEMRKRITELEALEIKRKRAEREIEERRLYLEGVLAAAPDAIVTLDAHHRIVEWNAGAARLFGYSREEVIGQNIDDLITNSDTFEEAVGFTQTVLSGKEMPTVETIRYRKDGSPVEVILAGSPIVVGDELIGVVGVYTDITERKKAEEIKREQIEKLETFKKITVDRELKMIELKNEIKELKQQLSDMRKT